MTIKLTVRDAEIIKFLRENKCAYTSTISNLFFNGSLRACQSRLKKLVDNGKIKAFRENILEENIYYVKKKPISYKHALKVTMFVEKLNSLEDIEIMKFRVPYKIGNLIADGLFIVKYKNKVIPLFLEVELTKFFKVDKYRELYYSRLWKDVFPNFPTIVVLTDKKVEKNERLNIIKIDTDFKDMKNIFDM